MRILFLLYFLPPTLGVAAKRNFRICHALRQMADQSVVFTSGKSSVSWLKEIGMEADAMPTYDYRYFLRKKSRDGALPELSKESLFTQLMIRLINSFPFNVIIGEGGLWYVLNSIWRGSRLIRKEGITHIYSSYRPFADHYSAFCLKWWFPKVVWIADFRDPPVHPHFRHILFPGLHHLIFKKIFSKADLLTTVSDGLAQHLRIYNHHVITLRNGIIGDLSVPNPVHLNKFTISYTGSMATDMKKVTPLFSAIHELITDGKIDPGNIQIIYAGKDGDLWKRTAKEFNDPITFINRGIVSGEESMAIQHSSCINVLLTYGSPELRGVLTGKLIEYLEAGSPVLGIVNGDNDEELQFILRETEIGHSFSDQPKDARDIGQFIWREYARWEASGMNHKPVNKDVLHSKYTMDSTIQPLIKNLSLAHQGG